MELGLFQLLKFCIRKDFPEEDCVPKLRNEHNVFQNHGEGSLPFSAYGARDMIHMVWWSQWWLFLWGYKGGHRWKKVMADSGLPCSQCCSSTSPRVQWPWSPFIQGNSQKHTGSRRKEKENSLSFVLFCKSSNFSAFKSVYFLVGFL